MELGQESDLELLTSKLPSPCLSQAKLLLWPRDLVDWAQGEAVLGPPPKSEASFKGLTLSQHVLE